MQINFFERWYDAYLPKATCCPKLDITRFDGKVHVWKNKLFLQDEVIEFMQIPISMSSVVHRMLRKIEKSKAMPNPKDFLMLCYDPSPWKSEIYMTTSKVIENEKMSRFSGVFVSRVFDGPYNHVPLWIKEMDEYLASRKKKALKYYFHYAYCPNCAAQYKHNYCVVYAQIKKRAK